MLDATVTSAEKTSCNLSCSSVKTSWATVPKGTRVNSLPHKQLITYPNSSNQKGKASMNDGETCNAFSVLWELFLLLKEVSVALLVLWRQEVPQHAFNGIV